MLETVEVRWFCQGEIPGEVDAWYRRVVSHAVVQGPRVDFYLRQEQGEGLGVKLREGRLELKQRREVLGLHQFAAGVAGHVERWHKWGYGLVDVDTASADAAASASWIAVQKSRRLGRFVVNADGRLRGVALEPFGLTACDCELTSISLEAGERWWTLGFEAYGEDAEVMARLLVVARQLLDDADELRLTPEASCGYAEWLASAEFKTAIDVG